MGQKIVMIGATGFIGSSLVEMLSPDNELVIFTRNKNVINDTLMDKNVQFVGFTDPDEILIPALENCQVIINLAGSGIDNKRWTRSRKMEILESRVQTLQKLSVIMERLNIYVELIIQASAIGYYGFSETLSYTEKDSCGEGFLAEIAQKWENATFELRPFTQRLVVMRLGVVLSAKGGSFSKMIIPFHYFLGGRIGSGMHWFSWIHLQDVERAVSYFIDNKQCDGVYNLVAPFVVRQFEFAKMLGKHLQRPTFFTTPSFVINVIFGQMGNELILQGTHAIPDRLMREGFKFQFPTLDDALVQIIGK